MHCDALPGRRGKEGVKFEVESELHVQPWKWTLKDRERWE